VQAAEFAATRVWQWSAGTVDGWSATGATLTAGPGSLTLTAASTDPALRVSGLSIIGSQNTRVRMRLRRLAGTGWDGILYYTTAGHGESASFRRVIPNLLPAGPFAILEWDMAQLTAGGSDWTASAITGLRFDLGSAVGDSFQIDWVAVGYIGPATEGAVWGASIQGQPADPDLLNSYQIIGQNLLSESDQAVGVRFANTYSPNGAAITAPVFADSIWTTADFALAGGRTRNAYIGQTNRHTGTTDTDADSLGNTVACDLVFDTSVPVIPGQRMCASAFAQPHRCRVKVYIAFFNVSGGLVEAPTFGAETTIGAANANALGNYERAHCIRVAPAGAARARMAVRKYNTVAGQTNSLLFLAAPQVEVIAANAAGPSPYNPGAIAAIGTDQLSEAAATDIVEFYDAAGYISSNSA
jgi:hypothetical protein